MATKSTIKTKADLRAALAAIGVVTPAARRAWCVKALGCPVPSVNAITPSEIFGLFVQAKNEARSTIGQLHPSATEESCAKRLEAVIKLAPMLDSVLRKHPSEDADRFCRCGHATIYHAAGDEHCLKCSCEMLEEGE